MIVITARAEDEWSGEYYYGKEKYEVKRLFKVLDDFICIDDKGIDITSEIFNNNWYSGFDTIIRISAEKLTRINKYDSPLMFHTNSLIHEFHITGFIHSIDDDDHYIYLKGHDDNNFIEIYFIYEEELVKLKNLKIGDKITIRSSTATSWEDSGVFYHRFGYGIIMN
jgi:hypothetical protein